MIDLILNILWIEGYIWYYLIITLICYGILFLVLFIAEKKRSTVVFGWMVLSSAMWTASMIGEDTFFNRGDMDLTLLFARLSSVGPLLLGLFSIWYAYLISNNEKLDLPLWKRFFLFVVPLTLVALSPTALHIESVSSIEGIEEWVPGILYYMFFVYGVAYMFIWFPSIVVRKLKRTVDVQERKYLKTLLSGFLFYSSGIMLFSVIFPTFFDIDTTAIAPFSTLPFMIAILYSILKNNIFNIKLASAEIFSVIIIIVMFMNLYSAKNVSEISIAVFMLIATLIFSIFFIRSVVQEIRSREKIQALANDLSGANKELTKWNVELERRVAEQTVDVRRAYAVEKKARQELERLDKAKTQFILNTQHHLRTPLTIVKGGATMLAEKKPACELSDADRLYAQKAMEAATRLGQLLNDFLSITSLKVDKAALASTVSPKMIIENILARYEPLIQQRAASVTVLMEDNAKLAVLHGKEEHFTTAFGSVIENALQYIRSGGLVTIEGRVALNGGTDTYVLVVTDTGIGMTSEEIQKAFNPFERSKRAEELYATGRGIGLVLTRSIIDAYSGSLDITSGGEGKGTRVMIVLPL